MGTIFFLLSKEAYRDELSGVENNSDNSRSTVGRTGVTGHFSFTQKRTGVDLGLSNTVNTPKVRRMFATDLAYVGQLRTT